MEREAIIFIVTWILSFHNPSVAKECQSGFHKPFGYGRFCSPCLVPKSKFPLNYASSLGSKVNPCVIANIYVIGS